MKQDFRALPNIEECLPSRIFSIGLKGNAGSVCFYDWYGAVSKFDWSVVRLYIENVIQNSVEKPVLITETGMGNNGHYCYDFEIKQ